MMMMSQGLMRGRVVVELKKLGTSPKCVSYRVSELRLIRVPSTFRNGIPHEVPQLEKAWAFTFPTRRVVEIHSLLVNGSRLSPLSCLVVVVPPAIILIAIIHASESENINLLMMSMMIKEESLMTMNCW